MIAQDPEEDKELRDELNLLMDKIQGPDPKLIQPALEMLKFIIRTSTTSMTSVPKPLKYLAPYYTNFKDCYNAIQDINVKKQCADIISVLAMSTAGGDEARKNLDCLRYCLLGTQKNIGDWGHEYIRQLEGEIVEQWNMCAKSYTSLVPIIQDVIEFDCKHNAEIQACDLLMEIDRLDLLTKRIDTSSYKRICLYLSSCTKYVEGGESDKILKMVTDQYIKFGENIQALICAMQLNDRKLVNTIFSTCKDVLKLRQMAFIASRQLFPVQLDDKSPDRDILTNILSNSHLNSYFQMLARELDVLEPKTPEEVYKTWLEPSPLRPCILGDNMDSARQNLASSFVNGFVNAGFGTDSLLTIEGGNKWIYRNKDHGMISATASLGLLHLWDVDGGLTPIDKYLYTTDDHIKAGALLAIGIVNCRTKNDCEPALALLADFINHTNHNLKNGAIFGLGLAYAGTNRPDVLQLLIPEIEQANGVEPLAFAAISCGLIAVGSCNHEVSNSILGKLLDLRDSDALKSLYTRLTTLGLGLCYMGCGDASSTVVVALEVFPQPFKTLSQCLVNMCAYSGSGDVMMIQKMLHHVSERIEMPEEKPHAEASKDTNVSNSSNVSSMKSTKASTSKDKKKAKREWDPAIAQAAAALGVGVVAMGEETGNEMCQRILGHMGRYGDPAVRRVMPLAIAITSVSRPHLPVIDVLTKYAHDSDDEVSCNAIFCLGIVGAGTNNARLSAGLRQLAVYHMRNPAQLFMVRLSQGLAHLGKGLLTLSPFHTDRLLLDRCSMAGLLIPLVALMDSHNLILGRNHYLMYSLVTAMYPRWLLTLDESLQSLSVSVRVGQAVDIVGKAGTPKTIAGIHTHTTPVLLANGERAELATDVYDQLCPTLDGICILKKVDA